MNDGVSQVKRLDPFLEERSPKIFVVCLFSFFFFYIVRTVLIEHYLYERIAEILDYNEVNIEYV